MTATTEPPAGRTDGPSGPCGAVLGLPGALVEGALRTLRGVEETLNRQAPVRALSAVPRTARFMGATAGRARGEPPSPGQHPVPSLTPAFAAQVAIDEVILALAQGPNRYPTGADEARVAAELAHARLLYDMRGWLDDPASYHRDPPALVDPSWDRGRWMGQAYERILFPSGWEPRPDEPGAERWAAYENNRTASATVLRHRDRVRPWVVGIHGFAMGSPSMDLRGLMARHLHHDLGLNVVLPVLPLHGSRRISRTSGEAFLSYDLMNSVHGLAQAVWDVRRILSWVRAQDAPMVGLYGVSLGGYLTSLVAGIDDGLDLAMAGIPVVDFPRIFREQSPHHVRLRAIEHEILDGNAEIVHRVVSPLAFPPKVSKGRRFVFAGIGDRMAPPAQAELLWEHWEEPEICWYAGNHVGYLWSRQVGRFVDDCLVGAGFVDEPEHPAEGG